MINLRKPFIAATHDITMAALSFLLSLYLRLGEGFLEYSEGFIVPATVLFTGVCAGVFLSMQLYRGVWRYASMQDLMALVKVVSLAILLFLLVMFIYNRLEDFPRSVFIINWFVLLALLGGPRFLYRIIKDRTLKLEWNGHENHQKIPVLLAGVNDHSEYFLRDTVGRGGANYEIVGILDNEEDNIGRHIRNVRVYGRLDSLEDVFEKLQAKGKTPQKLIVAPGIGGGPVMRELFDSCYALGLTMARLPRVTDFKSDIEEKVEVRPIAVEDLLRRPQTLLDRDSIREHIKGKKILITGAGGTIGSEIVRQVAQYKPEELTLFELSEHALYQIDKELEERFSGIKRSAIIGDVRDSEQLALILKEKQPDIVFHAAALKHVPLSEGNVVEAIRTNTLGSKNVADACVKAGIKEMVMISTDKAVNPTNVMGASKRAAENYVQSLGQSKESKKTHLITVRFGNVLGSSGSVIPLFKRQLEEGGPLTVTDPEITRYFMTVREAVELVLQAAVMSDSGSDNSPIFVLEMGKPVKIYDIAQQIIRLAGLEPEKDIHIRFTGLRPGEKLHEELFYDYENPKATINKSILLTQAKEQTNNQISKLLKQLEKTVEKHDKAGAAKILKGLVPEYMKENS